MKPILVQWAVAALVLVILGGVYFAGYEDGIRYGARYNVRCGVTAIQR